MKKLIILFFFLLALKPNNAYAVPLDISLSPALITIKTDGKDESTPKIYIQNKTTHNVSYDISLVPFQPSTLKNGEPILQDSIDKDYNDLFQNIIIIDDNSPVTKVDLAPQQKKVIKLALDLPTTLKKRDYYFSVIFTSSAENKIENSTATNINQALGVNILLSYGQQGQIQGEIKEFSASSFVNKGPVSFKIDLKNNSNNFVTASGNILIKNMFGQAVGNFDLKPTNVLANSQRIIENSVWNEKFLLGLYSAKVEISLSPSGPILTKQINFFAFPLEYIVFLIIIVSFIYYVRLRLKKKQTEN